MTLPIHCPKCAEERGVAIPNECPHQLVPVSCVVCGAPHQPVPVTTPRHEGLALEPLAEAIERVRDAATRIYLRADVSQADVLAVCDAAALMCSCGTAHYCEAEVAELLSERDVARAELRQQDEWRTGPAEVELTHLRATLAGIERLLRAGGTLHWVNTAGRFSANVFHPDDSADHFENVSLAAAVQAALAELDKETK